VVVTPGDEFEVPVTVANNVDGSGKNAKTTITLSAGQQLEILGDKQQALLIAEGRELTATFKLRARQRLGAAALTFVAALGGKQSRRTIELSVRPASPFLTTLLTGYVKPGHQKEVKITRRFYSEHQQHRAGVSGVPLTLAHGLAAYLKDFPHLCTEQLTSQGVPAVILGKSKEFGFTAQQAHDAVARFVERVWSRQNADGSFGVWAANPNVSPLASVYTLHVLTEARERGYPVPEPLLKRGQDYLQKLAKNTPDDLPEARVRSWAIYLLTRNAMVTTSYATAAQHWLAANHARVWQEDLAGAYLAAAYKLLKKNDVAEEIMGKQRLGGRIMADYGNYYDSLAHDAQLLYLWARHFPHRAAAVKRGDIEAMVDTIAGGSYNTFSSAVTIMALDALASLSREGQATAELIVQKIGAAEQPLRLPPSLMPFAPFSPQATSLVFRNPGTLTRYYLVSLQGFDSIPEQKVLKEGLEVFREYLDEKDKPTTTVKLGDELKVRFLIRAMTKHQPNVAIVDLLPAGFEVVVQPGEAEERESGESSDEGGGRENNDEGDRDSSGGDEGDRDSSGDEGDSGGDDTDRGSDPSERRKAERKSAPVGLPIAASGTTFSPDYWDVREDRVVLYGDAGTTAEKFVYVIKATNVGKFVVPPVQGASLYDRRVVARGLPGVITVTKPQ